MRFAQILALLLAIASPAFAADTVVMNPLDRVLGKDDAPVTVIEYASLTCPHCAHFHENVFPYLKKDWIDTGKIRFIYRDLPTSPVNLAIAGAMITQCAPKEHYFPLLGLLFRSQERWESASSPLDELKKIVGLAGLTPGDVDTCLARRDLGQAIQEHASEGGQMYGIESTPSLVIGGKVYSGAQSYDDINTVLKQIWAEKAKK